MCKNSGEACCVHACLYDVGRLHSAAPAYTSAGSSVNEYRLRDGAADSVSES